jgi:hypothetical protein
MNRSLLLLAAAVLVASTAGCSKSRDTTAAASSHSHQHTPPHGGTAVVLGNEAYHLELVHEPGSDVLVAYVLDGHMQEFIRINTPNFEVVANVNGQVRPLIFQATENAATGESTADTSHFEARAEWLKENPKFEGRITSLAIRGTTFRDVDFKFPVGSHP